MEGWKDEYEDLTDKQQRQLKVTVAQYYNKPAEQVNETDIGNYVKVFPHAIGKISRSGTIDRRP